MLFSGYTTQERILLTLNNNRSDSLTASLTAYTTEGRATTLADITLASRDSKLIELEPTLLNAGLSREKLGFLKVTYSGILMELGAQLSIYPSGANTAFDSPRTLAVDYKTGQRSSVFLVQPDSEVRIALTNVAEKTMPVHVSCGSFHKDLDVQPSATFVHTISVPSALTSASLFFPMTCELSTDGEPSALRAIGAITHQNYAAPIRFYDPSTATSQNLTAVGVSTTSETHISVHNVTDDPVVVTPVVRNAALANLQEYPLADQMVLPHGNVDIDARLALEAEKNAGHSLATITIKTKSPKGALVGAITQIDENGIVEDIPLRTSNPAAFDRGSYPLRWTEDYTNNVVIANTNTKNLRYRAFITAGDTVYVLPHGELEPNATMVFDVDRLRANAVPDVNGKILPKDAQFGKFLWSEMSDGRETGLLGRTSLASVVNRRRSSFSCGETCDYSDDQFPIFYNTQVFSSLSYGAVISTAMVERYSSANTPTADYPYPYDNFIYQNYPTIVDYGDYDPITITGSSSTLTETAVHAGSALVYYYFLDYNQVYAPGAAECDTDLYESTISAPVTVVALNYSGSIVNNTTQTAVIGQKITLTASYDLPSGVTVQGQPWNVPGVTIGGYTADYTGGATTATSFTNSSASFYWVTPGNKVVTYSLSLSDGEQVSATVTFNVEGPTNVSVASPTGTINVLDNDTLALGGALSNFGIDFQVSSNAPADFSGQFSWIQLITNSTLTAIPNAGGANYVCTYGPGFDGAAYPYDSGVEADDNPGVPLGSGPDYVREQASDSFRMYLMWTPNTSATDNIPIPLGYVDWGWTGDAVQNIGTGVWSLNSSGNNISPHTFTASSIFPTWTDWVDPHTNHGVSCQ